MQDFEKKCEAFNNWENIVTSSGEKFFTNLSEWSCYHKAKPWSCLELERWNEHTFSGVITIESCHCERIVCTFASSQSINNGRGISKPLGVNRRNIKRAKERMILLNNKKDAF
jgi:hypothetical protein